MKLASTLWQQVRHSGFHRERAREFLDQQLERTRVFLSKRNLRQTVSPVLVIVGALLLGYVGAQYGKMYLEQRHLALEWQRQQQASPSSRPAAGASRTEDEGLTP
jgi:hypothetical protein